MILEEAVNKIVRDIINGAIAPDYAYRAQQNAPRPSGGYATVQFMNEVGLGFAEKQTADEGDLDVSQSIAGYRHITMSLDFFRASAYDNARFVRTIMERETVNEILKAGKLGFVETSDVVNLSEEINANWEERGQFTLTLSAVGTDAEVIEAILAVNVSVDFQTRGLQIPINVEVIR